MQTTSLVLGFILGIALGLLLHASRTLRHDSALDRGAQRSLLPLSFSREVLQYETQRHRRNTRRVWKETDRVLCWVLTLNVTEEARLRILTTWGGSCDRLVFVAKDPYEAYDPLDTHLHGYAPLQADDLWNQVHRAWTIVADHYLSDYGWFVKLDTDSFFAAENFHEFLLRKQWSFQENHYFGNTVFEQSRVVTEDRAQFNLGAGYGVSQGLLRAVYPFFPLANGSSIPVRGRCQGLIRWNEDVKFRDCLALAVPSIMPENTRDAHQRENFLPFTPTNHFLEQYLDWYYRGKEHLRYDQRSVGCCSSRPVLWHGLKKPKYFWPLDYFTYDVAVDPVREQSS